MTARDLLFVYERRLEANKRGILKWPPELREGVESFVQKLKSLDPEESVSVVLSDGDPMARFVRTSTGELLWEHARRQDHGLLDDLEP